MAKKKQSAGRSKVDSAPRQGAKKSAKVGGKTPAARSADTRRALSNHLVGQTAGMVWQTLADNGPQPIAGLKKSIDAPDDVVLLAIGWLAREDKLAFETRGRSTSVALR